jgi:sarcosine oxidase, subunit gamma
VRGTMAADMQLPRANALGALADERSITSGGAIRIEIVPPRAVLNVRGPATASFVAVVEKSVGVAPPLEPNRWTGNGNRSALWLGPDEWLLVAPDGEASAVERALREASAEEPWLSVADVSHNFTRLRVLGPSGRELIMKGCALDLHPSSFGAGACVQTLLARTHVILRAVQDGTALELWIRNSFAFYATRWLLDAAAEFQRG